MAQNVAALCLLDSRSSTHSWLISAECQQHRWIDCYPVNRRLDATSTLASSRLRVNSDLGIPAATFQPNERSTSLHVGPCCSLCRVRYRLQRNDTARHSHPAGANELASADRLRDVVRADSTSGDDVELRASRHNDRQAEPRRPQRRAPLRCDPLSNGLVLFSA